MNQRNKPKTESDDVPPNVPDIFFAAATGNVSDLLTALNHFDVNVQDKTAGMTPLHHAAVNLQFEAVDVLLGSPGIDPTIPDNFGRDAAWLTIEVRGGAGTAMSRKLAPVVYARYLVGTDIANGP